MITDADVTQHAWQQQGMQDAGTAILQFDNNFTMILEKIKKTMDIIINANDIVEEKNNNPDRKFIKY